jgi:hypothetical protein
VEIYRVIGEVFVNEDGAQLVAQVEIGVAVREGSASDTGGVIGDIVLSAAVRGVVVQKSLSRFASVRRDQPPAVVLGSGGNTA